jgi:hypothetical protein
LITEELSFSKSAVLHELVTTLLVLLSGGRCDKYKCFAGVSNPCNRIIAMNTVRMILVGVGGQNLEELLPRSAAANHAFRDGQWWINESFVVVYCYKNCGITLKPCFFVLHFSSFQFFRIIITFLSF